MFKCFLCLSRLFYYSGECEGWQLIKAPFQYKHFEKSLYFGTDNEYKFTYCLCDAVLERHRGYEYIHHNEVADASAHDKEVEDLMRAEIFMPGVEDGQL